MMVRVPAAKADTQQMLLSAESKSTAMRGTSRENLMFSERARCDTTAYATPLSIPRCNRSLLNIVMAAADILQTTTTREVLVSAQPLARTCKRIRRGPPFSHVSYRRIAAADHLVDTILALIIREQAYLQILNEKDRLLISYKHQMT